MVVVRQAIGMYSRKLSTMYVPGQYARGGLKMARALHLPESKKHTHTHRSLLSVPPLTPRATHTTCLTSTHATCTDPCPRIFRESQVLLNWDKVGTLPWLREGRRDDYTVTFTTAGVRVERNGQVIGEFKTATEKSRLKYTFDPAAAAFHMYLHVTTEPDDAWSGYQRDLVTNLKGGKN